MVEKHCVWRNIWNKSRYPCLHCYCCCVSGFELSGFGIWSGILEIYSIKESSGRASYLIEEVSTCDKSYASEEEYNTETSYAAEEASTYDKSYASEEVYNTENSYANEEPSIYEKLYSSS